MTGQPTDRIAPRPVTLLPLTGLPEITASSDLGAELSSGLRRWDGLRDGDVLVVSSKVVSKADGLRLTPAGPGGRGPHADGHEATSALREAAVRRHTTRVVAERRSGHGTTQVVESVAGPVLAAAGVDASNTGPEGGVLLLPEDPDDAARRVHAALVGHWPEVCFGVVLSDTAGRPWRVGQTDLALGAHGVVVLDDLRGGVDADGRPLAVTARAVGDELAAAADLVKGKSSGVAAALVRGLGHLVLGTDVGDPRGDGARALARTGPGDWFALGHREAVRAALGARPGTEAAHAVGLPSVAPEPTAERAARAVRLAVLGHPGATIHGDPVAGFTVAAADPVTVGRVAARLEAALVGEDLTAGVGMATHP